MAVLITQREQEEALQQEAEERLASEQAARAEEDARLRELYPLPEDEEDYVEDLPQDDLPPEELPQHEDWQEEVPMQDSSSEEPEPESEVVR